MCIYLDVLIVLNIYVNYFLIKATAKFTHKPVSSLRCVLSALLGSLFSITILIKNMPIAISMLLKLIAALTIVACSFGIKDMSGFFKQTFYFYLINFMFGGIVMLMYMTFKPSFMLFNNAYFYIDFSLVSLVIFTLIAYAAISAFRFFLDKSSGRKGSYKVIIRKNNSIATVEAIADTGNVLVDVFTGKPVIICGKNELKCLDERYAMDFNLADYVSCKGCRIIPYSTIDNCGLIQVFAPDEIIIKNMESNRSVKVDALIGINPKDTPAIFNPGLLV